MIGWTFGFGRRLALYEKLHVAAEDGENLGDRIKAIHKRLVQGRRPKAEAWVYFELLQRMAAGVPLSEALHDFAPANERLMIAAGEENERVADAIEQLIKLLRQTEQTREALTSTGWRTAMNVLLAIGAVIGIAGYLAPLIRRSLDPKLWPPVTEAFFALTDWLVAWGGLTGLVTAVALTYLWRYTPLFYLYRLAVSAFLLNALSALVGAGESFNDALRMAARTTGPYVRDHVHQMMANIRHGMTEGVAMDTGMLPRALVDDLQDYAESRGFAGALRRMGDISHKRLNKALELSSSIAEYAAKLLIYGYLLWFVAAVGAAAMNAFGNIRV
jgi:type II secretory pathway component PulF